MSKIKSFDEIYSNSKNEVEDWFSSEEITSLDDYISYLKDELERTEMFARIYDECNKQLQESSYEEIESKAKDYLNFLDLQLLRLENTRKSIFEHLSTKKEMIWNQEHPEKSKQDAIILLKEYKKLVNHSGEARKKCIKIVEVYNSIERLLKDYKLISEDDLS